MPEFQSLAGTVSVPSASPTSFKGAAPPAPPRHSRSPHQLAEPPQHSNYCVGTSPVYPTSLPSPLPQRLRNGTPGAAHWR